jgi:hypothetical protein
MSVSGALQIFNFGRKPEDPGKSRKLKREIMKPVIFAGACLAAAG